MPRGKVLVGNSDRTGGWAPQKEKVASCFAQKRRPAGHLEVLEADDADKSIEGRPDCSEQPGGSFGKDDQASRTDLKHALNNLADRSEKTTRRAKLMMMRVQ